MSNPEQENKTLSGQSLNWSRIVEISDQLLQLAEQKNWDRLARLQIERDRLIEHFFQSETLAVLVTEVQSDIRKICDQDRKIMQMVADNRAQLGSEAQHLRAMKNRIEQYLSTEKS